VHSETYFRPSANAYVPTELTQERILYEAEKAYAPCVWDLNDEFDKHSSFLEAVKRLDMTSSPGYPYQREATTNGAWLKWNGVSCDQIQLARLWYDVQLVLKDKWDHIIRVFIKPEPHKKAKMEEGRWRLIMASSLPVQVAWHMLFGQMNDIQIEKSYHIPSQQGIVLVGGNWKQYYRSWKSMGTTCGVDKSSWDWTAPYWAIQLELQLRFRLARGERKMDWLETAKLLYRHMFEDPTLMTSDGHLFKQQIPGVMKSGCVNTISLNSHCQVFLHMAVCIEAQISMHPLPRVCGDDTLHHAKHTLHLDLYKRYGIQIKESSETTEFVGHRFTDEGPIPLYMMKHLKKMRYVDDETMDQYLDSMARMYVHTEYFEFWEKVAKALGNPLPYSRQYYKYWYDYGD